MLWFAELFPLRCAVLPLQTKSRAFSSALSALEVLFVTGDRDLRRLALPACALAEGHGTSTETVLRE